MREHPALHRRRLRYLASRRGNLEVELILRDFWEKRSGEVADGDLPDLEAILALEDLDLLDVFMGRAPLPEGLRRDIFEVVRPRR